MILLVALSTTVAAVIAIVTCGMTVMFIFFKTLGLDN